jgi:2-dehydropantoate 2-reductase
MGRYVIYGAGAVGGTIGARLHQAGHDVVLIARGEHLAALQRDGLRLQTPDEEVVLAVAAAGSVGDVDWRDGDVVMLAMKTQDTAPALAALAAVAPPGVAVVCAQNGVENERLALRLFPNVYGICVMLPASHLEPGVVQANGVPLSGLLDIGRFPSGSDAVADQVAADLSSARFSSEAVPAIMRFKYRKLIQNLGNAIEAATGNAGRGSDLYERAAAEGEAVLAAADIEVASREEDAERRGDLMRLRPIGGKRRDGGSSWQSLARGSGAIEADYLNGEIVLLGRRHGVVTPVNEALQQLANRMARDRVPPGTVSLEEIALQIEVLFPRDAGSG